VNRGWVPSGVISVSAACTRPATAHECAPSPAAKSDPQPAYGLPRL